MTEAWPFGNLDRAAYNVIAADPPWHFSANSRAAPGRNPRRHYATMSIAEIAALPVGDLAATDCGLLLWITGPMLAIGAHLPLLKAWRFKPKSIFHTWVKLNPRAPTMFMGHHDFHIGTGMTTRKNAEFVVLATRGRSLKKSSRIRELIVSPRREHSRKPEEFYERARAYFGPDCRYAELFARQVRPGWDAWGNEVEKFDTTTNEKGASDGSKG